MGGKRWGAVRALAWEPVTIRATRLLRFHFCLLVSALPLEQRRRCVHSRWLEIHRDEDVILKRTWSGLVALASAFAGMGAEPNEEVLELERFAPVDAERAESTFTVKPGFRVELVASEPLVRDPIEVCFDEEGRAYVVEMIDYSEMRGAEPHLGRIRRLEDRDGDGRYEWSGVYAEDLPWPTGVFCWAGGIFVAATPDVLFLKDTNADGRADVREVVFTGFASDYAPYETNRLNVQAMMNSFRWGLDNRVHGVTSLSGGRVRSVMRADDSVVELRGRDFAFDPRGLRIAAEAGGGQYGMSFDDGGTRFTCNNSDHVRVFAYEARYAARNPFLVMPPVLRSIAAEGPAAEVFRRSPEEPWRVIRTRWRVDGLVPGPIEGGGRASGYFTSATGLTIYRGDAWPSAYVGDVFVADCGSNLVHRKRTRRDGVEWIAERSADEMGEEFLASTDTWFRPVQLANAPDGTLWVIDMYREIIEHPWSLPPGLKRHLDLNAGNDRGRIYRVVPEGWVPRRRARLGGADTVTLVATLAHENGWHRDTAARLLYERQDRVQAVPALSRLLRASPSALGRLHALYALDGQGALNVEAVIHGMGDEDERVRAHGVRLSERFIRDLEGGVAAEVMGRLGAMATDGSPRVRYQLAFTLGETMDPGRIEVLTALALRDAADRWIRSAILSSVSTCAAQVFAGLFEGWAGREAADSEELRAGQAECLEQLARMIGGGNRDDDLAVVLESAVGVREKGIELRWVQALAEGLARSGPGVVRERLGSWLPRAKAVLEDSGEATGDRIRAIRLMGEFSFGEVGAELMRVLRPTEPQEVQLVAIEAMGRFEGLDGYGELTRRWAEFTPRVREKVLSVLLARPGRALILLRAVEEGWVQRSELDSTRRQFLRGHRDGAVREVAERVLAVTERVDRREVFEALRPALGLTGDVERGRGVFRERCAPCHRAGGEGYAVGPDLMSIRNAGREKLLMSIVDPGSEVLPQYVAYEVETVEGESYLGMLVEETDSSVTMRQAYAQDRVLARSSIMSLRASGRSMMPEEIEAGLDAQGMADLLEFVMGVEEPGAGVGMD
jgi:putative membrane-bound dehydrogenase-like protein